MSEMVNDLFLAEIEKLHEECAGLRALNAELREVLQDVFNSLMFYYRKYHPDWDDSAEPFSVIGNARTVLAKSEATS